VFAHQGAARFEEAIGGNLAMSKAQFSYETYIKVQQGGSTMTKDAQNHKVVSRSEWLLARRQLLAKEKAMTRHALQDPGPSEREGHSVFFNDKHGDVFHTYSCYARGNDMLNVHYHYLDMVPLGRDENGRGSYWVRRRDEYGR
jgi:predicted dithiol-disulfide oxidoreductase (DUF899 family)